MRPCIARDSMEKQGKQGLDLSAGSGLHALPSLPHVSPFGPLGALGRTVDPAPSPATLNLSVNVPLSQSSPSQHQLREILLAQLIRGVAGFAGIIQPAGPVISSAPLLASLAPPKSAPGRGSPPPAPLLTDAEADAAAAAAAAAAAQSSSAPTAAPLTTATSATAAGSAPPYRYPYVAHAAPPYYSPYPQQYYPPPYQDPCYPANYYHRALHYRRHYTYLHPSAGHAGPGPDPYAAAGSTLAVAPPVGAPLGAVHQMQMVVSSGPPPGAPPAHAAPPEYPVEPYVHYPAYPASETATYRCPCPMQSCPKNVHTGPLTGDGKGPKMQPLPPVALALPHEPPGLTPGAHGPPSPARGSAGMPPPPSPAAGATHRYHAWDNMESAKSVVKQDPGTPPDGTPGGTPPARTPPTPTGPTGLLAISKHDSPPTPGLGPPPPATGAPRRKRPAKGQGVHAKEEAVKLEDLKDVKEDVAHDGVATTEEATQTSPPPDAVKAAKAADVTNGPLSPAEKRAAPEDATPPSKKKKPSKTKKADAEAQGAEADGAAKTKAAACKSSKKVTAATTPSAENGKENSKKNSKQKKRAQSRAASVESNKSSGSAKRAKSRDKSQDKSQDKAESNNNTKSTSRDSSKSRSRSTSRSRLAEEEAAAAAVVAAAELPEGVPINQCRRLIAAQKKLISKCLAKKEREQARLAKQEATRAARLAALVRAAEAKKTPGSEDADVEHDGEDAAQGVATSAAARLTVPAVPLATATAPTTAPPAVTHRHHGHHHHGHHQDDPAVERSRVEALAAQAGLHVPACLTISQSELRLLESCAEVKAPKWSNGWQWRGTPFLHRVFLNCDDPPVLRKCFPGMQHMEGDNIVLGDTILLKSGTRKIDLPFVARVIHLWENPEDGEMMLSLVWFYRPEHTEQGRRPCDLDDEIFSSRHKDINSVACIEDKCYVLTFNEYCRYRKTIRRLEEGLSPPSLVVPAPEGKYPRHHRLPPGHVAPDMVFFCRKIYDFRQRRLQKNVF